MSSRRILAVALAAAALVAAGCGDDDDGGDKPAAATTTPATGAAGGTSAASGEKTTLDLVADPAGTLAFDKPTLEAKAGTVTINLDNPANLSHNIAIDGVAEQGEVVGKDGVSKLTTDLAPGTYTFYCAVPGHRQGGMQGTLTVK